MLDLGAGTGSLTEPLLAAGASVVAVELHPGRAAELRQLYAGARVLVVQVDAVDLRLPRRPFKVVANPPFSITAGIVRRLLGNGSRLVSAHLVVPAWSAARWSGAGGGAGGRGGAGRGSTSWTGSFIVEASAYLPRAAVCPPAPTDLRILTILRRDAGAVGISSRLSPPSKRGPARRGRPPARSEHRR
ncbi:MAG: rRNA adenine N-6-methyltransferase family protein [Acidimicrobiales bacterium]